MFDAPILPPGTLFAERFRIAEVLGTGGMAVVYVAEDTIASRACAIKVLNRRFSSDERVRQRFVQEASLGARIDSPHVVEVLGAGVEAASGLPWLAMELLRGADLAEFVSRGRGLPGGEAADVMQQLCAAVGAAHVHGVIHRDLKPENIFVLPPRVPGGPPFIKVLDFGIAKVLEGFLDAATTTDQIGTPLWMAPEQCGSPRAAVSLRTDVWALGLVAFYVLTGRHYWLAASDPACGVPSVLREMLFDPLVPASSRASTFGPLYAIPEGFDVWFSRCVVRGPEGRYADANRALAALRETWDGPARAGRTVDGSVTQSRATESTLPVQWMPGAGSAPSVRSGDNDPRTPDQVLAVDVASPGGTEGGARNAPTQTRNLST